MLSTDDTPGYRVDMEETIPTKYLVDRKRAAELAEVSERTVSRWAESGKLTVYRGGEHGRWVRYDRRQVLKVADGLETPFRKVERGADA